MSVLFLHGAGGYDDDQTMVAELREHLDGPVQAPRLPDEDMSYDAWRRVVSGHLHDLGPDVAVVAHSFGASVALRHAVDERPPLAALVLLAMPYWGPTGWGVAEYALPASFVPPPPQLRVSLHHCHDDQEVPFEHLAHHAAALPDAVVRAHPTGGHQLTDRMGAVALDLAPA
ncbi:hypothetical protein [Nocardioides sp. LHG3406-4]|uniref:hypothetical protein n=1 Tax=Nocardioides sp. LHG3406-4 TaxID=2804575 RepID=UPI003CE76744